MSSFLALTSVSPDPQALVARVRHHVRYTLVKEWNQATRSDLWHAFSLAAREQLVDPLLETDRRYAARAPKRLVYLSIEYLLGRVLGSALTNMGALPSWRAALAELGLTLDDVEAHEPEPAVGNGGLGRLAACFLDSLATLGCPASATASTTSSASSGRSSKDGWQRERPDHWMADDYPWLIERPDDTCIVPVYGRIEHERDAQGGYNPRWVDMQILIGVPHDMPDRRLRRRTVNCLRLFSARPSDEFDMGIFNAGDYVRAVEQKMLSRDDLEGALPVRHGAARPRAAPHAGVLPGGLRAARHRSPLTARRSAPSTNFADKVAIQMNDTHPALAVAELMRVLVDEHGLAWERAWDVDAGRLRLHEPHAAARSARAVAGARCSSACCRGICRSSTRSTAASSSEVSARFPGDAGARAADVADRGGADAAGAHGEPGASSAATR